MLHLYSRVSSFRLRGKWKQALISVQLPLSKIEVLDRSSLGHITSFLFRFRTSQKMTLRYGRYDKIPIIAPLWLVGSGLQS